MRGWVRTLDSPKPPARLVPRGCEKGGRSGRTGGSQHHPLLKHPARVLEHYSPSQSGPLSSSATIDNVKDLDGTVRGACREPLAVVVELGVVLDHQAARQQERARLVRSVSTVCDCLYQSRHAIHTIMSSCNVSMGRTLSVVAAGA